MALISSWHMTSLRQLKCSESFIVSHAIRSSIRLSTTMVMLESIRCYVFSVPAAKVLLFLHTCKKKVQFVEKPALFYLEVLCPSARSESMGPLRNVYLHAVGIKLPQAINAVRQYTRFSVIHCRRHKFIYSSIQCWLFVGYSFDIR